MASDPASPHPAKNNQKYRPVGSRNARLGPSCQEKTSPDRTWGYGQQGLGHQFGFPFVEAIAKRLDKHRGAP